MMGRVGLAVALGLTLAGTALAEECPEMVWGPVLLPGPQDFAPVGGREVAPGRTVMVVMFDKLVGDYPKIFHVIETRDDCLTRVVSLGSYAHLNEAAEGPNDRIYHLDLYTHDEHETLLMVRGQPNVQRMLARAFEVLAD